MGEASLLQPLEVLVCKWQRLTFGVVTDLANLDGFIAKVVFADYMTKMIHFPQCIKEITAVKYTKLFIDSVFHLHGVPKVIISDWDLHLITKF